MSEAARKIATEMIWVCQRLDQRQFVANHDGNVSQRLSDNLFLATPTARGKSELTRDDLIEVDFDGQTLQGSGKVFSEWKVHQAIYKARPDIQCVVHAHPTEVTALGVCQKPLLIDYLPEAVVSLGTEVPCIPFLEPLSQSQLHLVSKVAQECIGFLVSGNGIFSLGHDLKTTYFRIELAEQMARLNTRLAVEKETRKIPENLKTKLVAKHRAFLESCRAPYAKCELESIDDIVDKVIEVLG